MILDTRRLFLRLLRVLGANTICDVGSLNGADALAFRRSAPQATVLAFEANPLNAEQMQRSSLLRQERVEVVPMAVSDSNGRADFFVVDAPKGELARRGMSSLYQRADPLQRGAPVAVACVRLDDFLAPRLAAGDRLALWVDVEGKAFEALSGAAGILAQVGLVHVEVESENCIGATQKLHTDVDQLLRERGFTEVGVDRPKSEFQFNALYVRADLPEHTLARVRRAARGAFLTHSVWRGCVALLPPRLRSRVWQRRLTPGIAS
jgi:FkbM family methyltransferase